jgi:hypothetical protein
MKNATGTVTLLRFRVGAILVLCALLVLGTQAAPLNAQVAPEVDWTTTTTSTVTPASGYTYNYTAFGLYNETYYNMFYPLNYSGNLPLIIQFGGYAGVDHGLANLEEDAPLCGHLASEGYAVLEFGYDTGGTIPEASQTCLRVLTGTILPWVKSDSFPYAVDKTKIAICGHSAGGAAVLGLASPDVASSVALNPYYLSTSLVPQAQNIAPTLIVTGEADTLVPYDDNGTAYYSGLVAPKAILDIAGGGHNLGVGNFDFNTEGTNATLKYVTAWFDATLKGNSTAAGFFTSSYLAGDSGVNVFQLEMASPSDSPVPSGGYGGGGAGGVITYGIIIVAVLSAIVGFTVYHKRK